MEEKHLTTEQKSVFDLVITDNVERKIRYLCDIFPSTEWSGVLFYTVEGSFEQDNIKFTCVDIHPMDIGDATFTKFSDSPEIINYEINNNLLDGVYEGLIHSHHNMAAFFSGTDTTTLYKEGNDINHFLSLIVNNEGKYVAKVTRKIVRQKVGTTTLNYTESVSYNTFENEKVIIEDVGSKQEVKPLNEIKYEIQHYNLNIIKPNNVYEFETISKRLGEIKKTKAKTRPYSYGSDYDTDSWLHRSFTNPSKLSTSYYREDAPTYRETTASKKQYDDPKDFRLPKFSDTPKPNIIGNDDIVHYSSSADEPDFICDVDGIQVELDRDIIINLCNQLLTGNILFDINDTLDDDTVANLDDMYAKRFFITQLDFEKEEYSHDFESCVEYFMETLIFEDRPEIAMQLDVYTGAEPTYEDTYPLVVEKMVEYMEYKGYDKVSKIAKYMIEELKKY